MTSESDLMVAMVAEIVVVVLVVAGVAVLMVETSSYICMHKWL